MRRARALAAVALAACLMVMVAAPASAHATLLQVTPSDTSVVTSSPEEVTLRYDQPVNVSTGAVKVLAPDGSRVDSGAVTQREQGRLVASILRAHLAKGTYTILWRVVSADTHTIFGASTFSVGQASATGAASAAAAEQASTGQKAKNLLDASRLVLYLGVMVLVGGVGFLLVVWPAGQTRLRARRLLWGGWALAALGSLVGALLQGASAQGRPLTAALDPELLASVVDSRYGAAAIARLAVLALLAVVLMRPQRMARAGGGPAAVLCVGLLVTTSAVGHAATGDWSLLAWPLDVLHMGAAAAWLGGLTFLGAFVLARPGRAAPGDAALGRLLLRWSRYAATAVAVLVATGVYAGIREVGEPGALLGTAYGRLLLVKLGLVILMLGLAAIGRAWVRSRYASGSVPAGPAVPARPHDLAPLTPAALPTGGAGPAGPLRRSGLATLLPVSTTTTDGALYTPPAQHRPGARPGALGARSLRRSVLMETGLAVVVLAVTAVLVDTAPARESYFPVFEGTAVVVPGESLHVLIDPARTGLNQMTVDYSASTGRPVDVVQATARWTRKAGGDVVPVQLVRTAAGRYALSSVQLPSAGSWQLDITTQTSDIDAATSVFTVQIR